LFLPYLETIANIFKGQKGGHKLENSKNKCIFIFNRNAESLPPSGNYFLRPYAEPGRFFCVDFVAKRLRWPPDDDGQAAAEESVMPPPVSVFSATLLETFETFCCWSPNIPLSPSQVNCSSLSAVNDFWTNLVGEDEFEYKIKLINVVIFKKNVEILHRRGIKKIMYEKGADT
jgi:hypothetical protein